MISEHPNTIINTSLPIPGLAASAQGSTVAYWRFEEGAPNQVASGPVHDSAGTNDGSPFGIPMYSADVPVAVIPQTGAPNTLSLELTTSFQDRVAFASAFPFNQPGDVTLEFWLKWNYIHHGAILWGRPDTAADENRFQLHANFDFTFGLEYRSPSNELHALSPPGDGTPQNGVPLPQGQWGHVAITRQGDTYRIYVNGVLQSTVTDVNPDLPNLDGWSLAGRHNQPFVGLVDEMRVSNEALTPDRFLNSSPLIPQQAIRNLIEKVKALVAAGVLNQGNGNALIAKLEVAIDKLDKGRPDQAIEKLQIFIHEVETFMSTGKLPEAEGLPLVNAAIEIIAVLGG
ncbi:MAG: LamG domain-containing protein [Acidobacteria bacterium]|nr:LamG domain-containing protein [Acidobacteriota bacterium]